MRNTTLSFHGVKRIETVCHGDESYKMIRTIFTGSNGDSIQVDAFIDEEKYEEDENDQG